MNVSLHLKYIPCVATNYYFLYLINRIVFGIVKNDEQIEMVVLLERMEPFGRINKSQTRPASKTGLGLERKLVSSRNNSERGTSFWNYYTINTKLSKQYPSWRFIFRPSVCLPWSIFQRRHFNRYNIFWYNGNFSLTWWQHPCDYQCKQWNSRGHGNLKRHPFRTICII